MFFHHFVNTLILFSAVVFFSSCSAEPQQPLAVKGVLDLRQWDFSKHPVVKLDGEWDFYWQKFKDEITEDDRPSIMNVPAKWNNFIYEGKKIENQGYAYYRLKIFLPENQTGLFALKYKGTDGGSRFFINGSVYRQGRPGKDLESSEPVRYFHTVSFEAQPVVEIGMDAANFHHRAGGIKASLEMGKDDVLRNKVSRARAMDAMYFASYFIMALYHILFYLLYKKRMILYFALFSLILSVRMLFVSEIIIFLFYPGMPLMINYTVEYLTFYIALSVFSLFLYSVFPDEFNAFFRNVFFSAGILFSFSLFLPFAIFTEFIPYFQIITLALMVISIYSIFRAVYNGRRSARTYLAGFISLSVGISADIYVNLLYGSVSSYSAFGLLIFVFSMGSVLSFDLNRASRDKEKSELEAIENQYKMNLLKMRNDLIEKDLAIARDIEMKMLPDQSDKSVVDILYLPSDKIGGDLVHIAELNEGRTGIFIGDVSGHGIPAALISIMIKTIIKNMENLYRKGIEKYLLQPEIFLYELNRQMYGNLNSNFATGIYGVYSADDSSFTYASAGHVHPIVLSESGESVSMEFLENKERFLPLGILPPDSFDPKKIKPVTFYMKKNQRMLLYTDGLLENVNYDFTRMHEGIQSLSGTALYDIFINYKNMPGKEFTHAVRKMFSKNGLRIEDDVCVAVLDG